METLEYKKVKISVPTCWDDITLGAYERLSKTAPVNAREKVQQVAAACGINADVLLNWPEGVFTRIVGLVQFLYVENTAAPVATVDVDGVTFVVAIEDELTLGEYIDADEAGKKSDDVLSSTLAIVCRPVGEAYDPKLTDARQKVFAALPMSKVLGVLAFFLRCKTQLETLTNTYKDLLRMAELLPRSIKSLRDHGVGIRWYRIWPTVKYLILIRLLRYRLQRYLPIYNTGVTKK